MLTTKQEYNHMGKGSYGYIRKRWKWRNQRRGNGVSEIKVEVEVEGEKRGMRKWKRTALKRKVSVKNN